MLDIERPCLACGEPWRRTWTPSRWGSRLIESSECSARCWLVDLARHQRGIAERLSRGW